MKFGEDSIYSTNENYANTYLTTEKTFTEIQNDKSAVCLNKIIIKWNGISSIICNLEERNLHNFASLWPFAATFISGMVGPKSKWSFTTGSKLSAK